MATPGERIQPLAGSGTIANAVAGTKLAYKTGPVTIRGMSLLNTTAAVAYLQVFDKTSANTTVGTTTPNFTLAMPASAGLVVTDLNWGFANAVTLAGTTTQTGSTGAAIDVSGWGDGV